MEELLTARQIQEALKINRITIYRMLEDGRLKGVKVGSQWRFPASEVERLLNPKAAVEADASCASSFPGHCVQAILDVFGAIGLVSALAVAADGQPLTPVSHACGFCRLLLEHPSAEAACQQSWREIAVQAQEGRSNGPFTCHAGLSYTTAPLREDGKLIAFLLAGQAYFTPPDPARQKRSMRSLLQTHSLPVETFAGLVEAIPVLDEGRQKQLQEWPALVAGSIESILSERAGLVNRLQRISELTNLG